MQSKEKYVNQGTATLCPVSHLEKFHIVYRETKSRCRVYKHLLYVLRLSKIYKISYQEAAEIYIRSLPRCRGGNQPFNYIDKYFNVNVSQYYFNRKQTHKKLRGLSILCNSWIREISRVATKELRQVTNLKMHGEKNYNNREQAEETNLKNLGVKNVMQDKTIAKRCRKSMGDKYPLAQLKREATNEIKYGFKISSKSPQVREKLKDAWKSKSQDEVQNIVIKRKDSMGDWKAKYREITEKALRTKFNKRYGENFNKEYILKNFVKDGLFLAKECAGYFKTNTDGVRWIKKFFNLTQYRNASQIRVSEENFLKTIETEYNIILERQKVLYPSRYKADGFISLNIVPNFKGVVFEYLGDIFHGILNDKTLTFMGYTHKELYEKTFERFSQISKLGYKIFYVWESDFNRYGLKGLKEYISY